MRAVPPAFGAEIVIVENSEAYRSSSGELWGYVGPWKGTYFDTPATLLKAEYQQALLEDASKGDEEAEPSEDQRAHANP